MLVTFGHKHKWTKDIESDILVGFGKNNTKKIRAILQKLGGLDINFELTPLNQSFLSWFTPLYNQRISSRDNPSPHDIYSATLGKTNAKYQYNALTIFEAGVPVGGAIFTLRTNRLSIAFRAYLPDWRINSNLACTPALFGEYILTKHAQEKNKSKLVHGSDRNPYGFYSNIGVAIFKLSVGCYPVIHYSPEIQTIDIGTINKNILILEFPKQGRRITDAYLLTSKDAFKNFEQVTKYESQLKIHVVFNNLNQDNSLKN